MKSSIMQMFHFIPNFATFNPNFGAKNNIPSLLRVFYARVFKSKCLCKTCMKK